MNRFIIASLLLIAIVAVSEAAVAQQLAKQGETVTIDLFKGAKAIKRKVKDGEQIFHLEGANKGSFVDAKGKKVESSNYEVKNGGLVIKKFSAADVGQYQAEPNLPIETKHDDGSISAVPGNVLNISLE